MNTTDTGAEARPLTSTERARALRERREREGLAEVRGIFAPAADHVEIKAYAVKLAKRREREAKRAARQAAAGRA